MALRKPIAFSAADAFHEEIPVTDTIQLGGATLTGDLAFSGGTAKVTGSAAGTTAGDGIVYGQSAASLAGLTMTGNVAMGSNKVTGLGAATTSGDALSYAQAAASLAGLTMTGTIAMGSHKITGLTAASTSGDALSYGQSSASLAGLALTAALTMGTNKITGLGDPTAAQDAATKNYVDGLINGVAWLPPVLAVATANQATVTGLAQTIDGVALNTGGQRVLLTAQTSAVNNGVWVVAAGAWTRSTDMAAGADASGDATFCEKGTLYADTGWVCTSDTGSAVVGTNNLVFVQFSQAGVITAGSGLVKSGTVISTKQGDGIEIVSNTASTNVALDASAPGIQFTGSSPNGKLQVKADPNQGLQVVSTGVGIKLNGATLAVGASGASVAGVPSLFTINGVAVSANVTSANLGTLTAGVASNADALHTHTAIAITKLTHSYVTTSALSAGDPVYMNSTNNQVDKAQANTDAKARVIAVNSSSAVGAAGTAAALVSHGPQAGILTAATAGTPYYLAASGGLTTSVLGSGNRIVECGVAINATDLFVRILDFGKKP